MSDIVRLNVKLDTYAQIYHRNGVIVPVIYGENIKLIVNYILVPYARLVSIPKQCEF